MRFQASLKPDHARGHAGSKLLIVTFASAPGVPNWGGVLSRLAAEASPEERDFDIFFVCDGGRNWYSGLPTYLSVQTSLPKDGQKVSHSVSLDSLTEICDMSRLAVCRQAQFFVGQDDGL